MNNIIRDEIVEKDILFQQLFTNYQAEIRKNPLYINYEAFRDVKIIFDLYSQTFQLKGFNYNELNENNIKELIKPFNDFQQKELLAFLIDSLIKNGNTQHSNNFKNLLIKIEIKCCLLDIGSGKKIIRNLLLLIQKTSSYNILSLFSCIMIYISFSCIIYSQAPYPWMQLFDVKPVQITESSFLNHIGNVIFYIFDFDSKMEIVPTNFFGVFVMVFLKCFFILVIVNFIIKETLNKLRI